MAWWHSQNCTELGRGDLRSKFMKPNDLMGRTLSQSDLDHTMQHDLHERTLLKRTAMDQPTAQGDELTSMEPAPPLEAKRAR